jgi:hypothetical protein
VSDVTLDALNVGMSESDRRPPLRQERHRADQRLETDGLFHIIQLEART